MTTFQISQAPAQHLPAAGVVLAVPVCACGQDLDRCHGRHCPRCGRTLLDTAVAMIPAA